jgi:hypothetical protein
MRNTDLLVKKIDSALEYLYEQEQNLKPYLDKLSSIMKKKIDEEELSAKEAFNMYLAIQSQYTNNFLLMAKLKEMLDFKEVDFN